MKPRWQAVVAISVVKNYRYEHWKPNDFGGLLPCVEAFEFLLDVMKLKCRQMPYIFYDDTFATFQVRKNLWMKVCILDSTCYFLLKTPFIALVSHRVRPP